MSTRVRRRAVQTGWLFKREPCTRPSVCANCEPCIVMPSAACPVTISSAIATGDQQWRNRNHAPRLCFAGMRMNTRRPDGEFLIANIAEGTRPRIGNSTYHLVCAVRMPAYAIRGNCHPAFCGPKQVASFSRWAISRILPCLMAGNVCSSSWRAAWHNL